MNSIASEVVLVRGYLGAELWFMLVAFGVGAAARLGKFLLPANLIPMVSVALGCAAFVGVALLVGEDVAPALATGALAGSTAVAGHELAKKLLERLVGAELAEKILGLSADKISAGALAAADAEDSNR